MKKWFLFAIGLALVLVQIRIWGVSLKDESSRHFIRGDFYSDKNTHSAVLYWRDHGLLENHLRPVHNYPEQDQKDGTKIATYTHYPALPDVFTYLGAQLFGFSEPQMRVLPFVLSLLTIFIWWTILQQLPLTRNQSLWSLSFIVLSNAFVFWADNLHKHLHEYATNALWVLLIYMYYLKNQKTWLWFFGVFLAIWTIQSSFESTVVAIILVAGSSVLWNQGYKKILHPLNFYLAISFILGFGIHIYLNALHFGSVQAAIQDLVTSAQVRLGQSQKADEVFNIWQILSLPYQLINRAERYFWIPGWAFLFVGFWGLQYYKAQSQKLYHFIILVCVASVTWYLVMPQHAYVHHFTAKHLLIPYLILSVPGLEHLLSLRQKTGTKQKFVFVLMMYILVMGFTQQLIPMVWTFTIKPAMFP